MRGLAFLILQGLIRGVTGYKVTDQELTFITIVLIIIWMYDIYRFSKRVIKWIRKNNE